MHPVFSQLLVLHLISYSIAKELISSVGKVSYVSTAPQVINTRLIESIKVETFHFQSKQNLNFSYNILSFRKRRKIISVSPCKLCHYIWDSLYSVRVIWTISDKSDKYVVIVVNIGTGGMLAKQSYRKQEKALTATISH